MPTRNKTRAAAQKPRKGVRHGKNRKKHGRKGSERTKASGPRVIANSVFALTIGQKLGIEVQSKLQGSGAFDDGDDYEKMYKDLIAAFHRCMKLAGKPTYADPFKEGLQLSASLAYVISGFKNNLLPNGWDMRVDKDGSDYYFSAYVDCSFPDWWHAIEIMPVIEDIKRYCPNLLPLYIEFIAYFYKHLDIPTWWSGGMGYSEYMMEDQIDNWEDNMGNIEAEPGATESQKKDAKLSLLQYEDNLDTFNSYNAGEVKEYENILSGFHSDKKKLIARINKCRSNHPMVAFMKKAMLFMEEPISLDNYVFHEIKNDDAEGLDFDRQVTLIWDWNDPYTRMEMDAIDVDAQNYGIKPPLLHRYYTKYTKSIPDADQLAAMQTWPQRFSKLWIKYRDIVYKIRKKLKITNEQD